MAPKEKEDPLGLADLNPDSINERIAERAGPKQKPPTELDLKKEARLAEKEKRLAASLKAPSEDPPTAPPPPINDLDRSVLLDKIFAYRERFPQIKKRNNVSAKSSIEEIADELHYCELQLGSRTTHNLPATVFMAGMMGIEKGTRDYWNPLGLNLNGLTAVTQQNMDEFQPILDELQIRHNAGLYTSPEWRLALAIGASILTVNAANQNPETARAVHSMNQTVKAPKDSKDL